MLQNRQCIRNTELKEPQIILPISIHLLLLFVFLFFLVLLFYLYLGCVCVLSYFNIIQLHLKFI